MTTKPPLLPLHALPDDPSRGFIRRRVGRPRLARPKPTADEIEYIARTNVEADLAVEADSLVRALRDRADIGEVIQKVRERIAVEIAVLEFEARRQREGGRDSAMTHGRIIDALGKLAALELARAKWGIDSFDPRSPRVQRVVEMLVESVASIAAEVLSAEEITKLMIAYRAELEGWEDDVHCPVNRART